MELSRGVCVLCTNNTNIIVPPQAKDLTVVIKDVLVNQCDDEKFDAINSSLKICPVCVHDVLTTASLRKNIKEFDEYSGGCVLCSRKKTHLVLVSDWVHFDKTLKNVTLAERQNVTLAERQSDSLACLDCIKCLGMLERIKTNLFKKYPNLRITDLIEKGKNENTENKKKSKAKIESAKRTKKNTEYEAMDKSDLESFLHNKNNVNDVKAALKHLTPVKNTKFNIVGFKDKKLLKQIPYVKLNLSNMSVTKSTKSVISNFSENESSGDSPSPKQSFFKIRLKISSNKPKIAKILSSKVTKPRIGQSALNCKKQLVVRISKMDLDQITLCHVENDLKNTRTPTKASRKMLPDESLSSSKKRKSVTFAEELDTEIVESLNRKNHLDATPLKSSLKKKNSHSTDFSKIGNDESNNETDDDEVNLQERLEVNYDSDEEILKKKSYVEEILKNNDDIFNSLKNSQTLEVASTELKSQMWSDTNISSSKNDIVLNESEKTNKDDVSESEGIQSSEIENIGERDSLENGHGETNDVDQAAEASDNEVDTTKENEVTSVEEEEINETNDKSAVSDEDDETSIGKTNGGVNLENKQASVEKESSKLDDPHDELDIAGKSTDQECSEISDADDADDVSSISKNTIETNDNENEISSTVNIDSVQSSDALGDNTELINNKVGTVDDKNKSNEDLEAFSETGKKSVSKKRRRSTLERDEEDKDLIDDNGFGEPETKKEKVSEMDDLNNAVSEKEIEPEEDDNCSEQTVAAVDNKIDELLAKYTNAGVQNLNVDNNVSDSRNAGANGKDQGSRSEDSPGGSEEAVDAADERSDNFKNNSEEEKSDEVTSKNTDSALTGLNTDDSILDIFVDDDSFIASAKQ